MASELLKHYQEEHLQWEQVNRQLKHHGLRAISLLEPSAVPQSDDVIGFSSNHSAVLRDNLVVLMKDGDRRQTLIQDLILTNNTLRNELETKGLSGVQQDDRVKDLQNLVDIAESRNKELEATLEQVRSQSREEREKESNTKVAVVTRHKQLEKRCELQEEEMNRLRTKLLNVQAEQEKREERVKDVFQTLKRGGRKSMTSSDQRLLDIIDTYEAELSSLRKKLASQTQRDISESAETTEVEEASDTSVRYKELIQSFNKDLQNSDKELKRLQQRNDVLELELQARPTLDDFNKAKQKVRHLEKLLQEHGINIYSTDKFNKKTYSTKTEDIDYLPLQHCRRYLKEVCEQLELSNLTEMESTIAKHISASEGFPKLQELLMQVVNVVEPSITREKQPKHKLWCNKHWKTIIPKLEVWSNQISQMHELRHVTKKLLTQFDKSKETLPAKATVAQITEALEGLTADPAPSDQLIEYEQVSPKVLSSMVRHFQHLFDVPKVSGVFPRMSEIYSKYNEMKNFMNTLAELLALGPNCKGSDIVDAVGRICQGYTSSTYNQLKQLLQEDDLDNVIQRLDEHRNCMPLFRDVINQVMNLLDVTRIDQIIPSVRALKLMIS